MSSPPNVRPNVRQPPVAKLGEGRFHHLELKRRAEQESRVEIQDVGAAIPKLHQGVVVATGSAYSELRRSL